MGEKKEYIERGALIRLFDERYITAIVQQKHDDVPEDHKKHWKGVQSGTNWCKNTVLEAPAADVVEVPEGGLGELSDGYHTFNELYHHRAILFSVICNSIPDKAWKSKLHDTGDMFDGMFIVGIETPEGQATYHYDIEPYWEMFKVKELEKAPKWDGHTPKTAIERISKISADVVEVRHSQWDEDKYPFCNVCPECGLIIDRTCIKRNSGKLNLCPTCGAKMDGERKDIP